MKNTGMHAIDRRAMDIPSPCAQSGYSYVWLYVRGVNEQNMNSKIPWKMYDIKKHGEIWQNTDKGSE